MNMTGGQLEESPFYRSFRKKERVTGIGILTLGET